MANSDPHFNVLGIPAALGWLLVAVLYCAICSCLLAPTWAICFLSSRLLLFIPRWFGSPQKSRPLPNTFRQAMARNNCPDGVEIGCRRWGTSSQRRVTW
jgi:hypothetical protein